ncbi:putative integrase catalytic domain-containing protein [Phytophthora infestans]|uniref:Putative integrase catalytic domain-containing protein n=1 Tax=Phytophthora infestans TaxID=4787 RepID=A0A833SEB3_PHYIN|nr:putative integrase catalytic domain-containing protein [Phytophthora infestans]
MRLRFEKCGKYMGRQFKDLFDRSGIRHEKPVPDAPQKSGLAKLTNRRPREDGSAHAQSRGL